MSVAAPQSASPAFFDHAPTIVMRDSLAEFLGAVEGGVIEYRYADAVRLAGHSCPTVAGAWLMARAALRGLYPEGQALPERGAIRIDFRERSDAGVTGVIANVLSLVTGAAGDGGFPGIGGRFVRRERLFFEQPVGAQVRFTRLDNDSAVEAETNLSRVPGDPRMAWAMSRSFAGEASAEESALFRELWQERVRRVLVEHADDPELITIKPVR